MSHHFDAREEVFERGWLAVVCLPVVYRRVCVVLSCHESYESELPEKLPVLNRFLEDRLSEVGVFRINLFSCPIVGIVDSLEEAVDGDAFPLILALLVAVEQELASREDVLKLLGDHAEGEVPFHLQLCAHFGLFQCTVDFLAKLHSLKLLLAEAKAALHVVLDGERGQAGNQTFHAQTRNVEEFFQVLDHSLVLIFVVVVLRRCQANKCRVFFLDAGQQAFLLAVFLRERQADSAVIVVESGLVQHFLEQSD